MLATAAAVLVLVGVGSWLMTREPLADRTATSTQYVSTPGQLKNVVLTDGTIVTMNSQSELHVSYTRGRRDVRLDSGEALFTIAHDPSKPFSVQVGDWKAVALGTAFVVRRLSGETAAVTVTEGVVEMQAAIHSGNGAWPRLTRNQVALLGADALAISQVSDAEISKRLAWRNHMVVFSGETLGQAVAEMNRYSSQQIVVEDPELTQQKIVGVFSTVDTRTFISGMESTLGVQAIESDHTVVLRPRR
jgi:transmembrane sensor